MHLVFAAAEFARHGQLIELLGQARVDLQAVVIRLNAQNPLRRGVEAPRRRAGQPTVLRLAEMRRVRPRDHLAVHIRLGVVQLLILDIGRAGAAVDVISAAAVAERRLRQRNPRVVVAEDAAVLLVSRRIGADFAQLDMVARVRRRENCHTVLAEQLFADGIQRALRQSFLHAHARHDQEALRLDVNLPLVALV